MSPVRLDGVERKGSLCLWSCCTHSDLFFFLSVIFDVAWLKLPNTPCQQLILVSLKEGRSPSAALLPCNNQLLVAAAFAIFTLEK